MPSGSSPDRSPSAALPRLPRVDALLRSCPHLVDRYGRNATVQALRSALEDARRALLSGRATDPPGEQELLDAAAGELAARRPGPPRRVLNASGVVIHTNLGRAPLGSQAIAAIAQAAGYCDLEFDLAGGGRGSRSRRLDPLLTDAAGLGGAVPGMPEIAGMAVNNAAAALVLALATLAAGREVPVSRGELVEIGGSFRLPDIMAVSGARLLEVGTTNRTRAQDYRAGGDVGLLLKVHPSNYRVSGFTEAPSVAEVAAVARERGVPLLHDVGSGLLSDVDPAALPWAADEPSVHGSLRAGADLVICSGDKLLGGPQAGLLLGRPALVDRCRRHPLARAVRLDKLRIAALVVTLEAHLAADGTPDVPTWRMLRADPDELAARSRTLAAALGARAEVTEAVSLAGGGSAPEQGPTGPVVRVGHPRPEVVARRLRGGEPPVVARVDDGALWVDLRTVDPAHDALLTRLVGAAVAAG